MIVSYNFHTHTARCGHANGTMEEYVLAAIKAGVKVLGFSDHTPYKDYYLEKHRMKAEWFQDYVRETKELKEKYKDQIEILVGLEMEYFVEQMDELKEYYKQLDYAIIGQHESKVEGGFNNYVDTATSTEALETYGQQIVDAIHCGMFSYVAHPDLFMYAKEKWDATCEKITHDICKAAKETNTPLELNMGGIGRGKKRIGETIRFHYPVVPFWEIARSYNVRIVVGVDAHTANDFLNEENFKEMQYFIDELKLQVETNFRP